MLGPCLRIPWSTTRIDRDFSVECVFRNAAVTRTRRNHSLRRSDQQMALIIIASMLLLLPSSQSLPLSPRTSLVSHRARLRYSQRLSMSNDEESKAREEGRPPVIPFDFSDFARKDLPLIPGERSVQPKTGAKPPVTISLAPPRDADPRPTGYANNDSDEDAADLETLPPDDEKSPKNPVVRFFRDVYVGSPYDSRRRQQARYVVRNITGISVAIGLIFTLLWYLAPNKFISYKGDKVPVSYMEQSRLLSPDDMLQDIYPRDSNIDSPYLDDGTGTPDEYNKRIPLPLPKDIRGSTFNTQNI